jgi:hypothetical protein
MPAKADVGSNTTLHWKRKDLKCSSPTRIPVQTESDIAEWEEQDTRRCQDNREVYEIMIEELMP